MAKAAKKADPQEMLIVQSKAKDVLRNADCMVASDALESLNAYVYWLLDQAAKRAASNGRKTVKGSDFLIM